MAGDLGLITAGGLGGITADGLAALNLCGGGGCDCRCPESGAAKPSYCCDSEDPRYNNPECRCEPVCQNAQGVYKILPMCCAIPTAQGGCAGSSICSCVSCATSCCPTPGFANTGMYTCPGQPWRSSAFIRAGIGAYASCLLSSPCQQMFQAGAYSAAVSVHRTGTYTNCLGGRTFASNQTPNPRPASEGASFNLLDCANCSSSPNCTGPVQRPGVQFSRTYEEQFTIRPNGDPMGSVNGGIAWSNSGYPTPMIGGYSLTASTGVQPLFFAGPTHTWQFGGLSVYSGPTQSTVNCAGQSQIAQSGLNAFAFVMTLPVYFCSPQPSLQVLIHPECVDPDLAARGLYAPRTRDVLTRARRLISIPTAAEVAAVARGGPLPQPCSNCPHDGGLTS